MDEPQTRHQHTVDEERRNREAALDHTIAATFPASDPLSSDPNPDDCSAVELDEPSEPRRDRRGESSNGRAGDSTLRG